MNEINAVAAEAVECGPTTEETWWLFGHSRGRSETFDVISKALIAADMLDAAHLLCDVYSAMPEAQAPAHTKRGWRVTGAVRSGT